MPDTSRALWYVCAHVHTRVTEQKEIPDVTVLLPAPLQQAQLGCRELLLALGRQSTREPLPWLGVEPGRAVVGSPGATVPQEP